MRNATSMSVRTALIAACASAALSQKERPRPMTPDPITTAHGWTDEVRQAVTALEDKYGIELISGPHHAKWVDAACYEIGGGSIRMYKDDVEKLKAERDEWKGHYERVASEGDVARAEITRLTSRLEQAETILADLAKQIRPDLLDRLSDNVMFEFSVRHSRAASQWIKDRQAKTDAIGDK